MAPGVVHNDVIIVGSLNGSLHALRLADGSPVWSIDESGGPSAAYRNRPALIGSQLFIVRGDGRLEARDPGTGALRWSHTVALSGVPTPCGRFVCVAGARFFVFSEEGELAWAYGGGSTNWGAARDFAIDESGTIFAGVINNFGPTTFQALRLPIDLF